MVKPYRDLDANFDREWRNDINANFDDIEKDIKGQKDRVDNLIQNVPQPSEVVDIRQDTSGVVHPTAKGRIDAEFNKVMSDLAQKATKEELNSLGQLKLNGTYATLADLQTAYPTGAEGLYLVTADGFTYRWDSSSWVQAVQFQSTGIADKSVDMNKLSTSIVYPDNLFNLSAASDNTVFDPTTGNPLTANGYMLSDFIEVQLNGQYTIANANLTNAVAVYDINKAYLGKVTGTNGNNNPYTFTILNASAVYVRINIDKSKVDVNTYMMVKDSQLPEIYVPYNKRLYKLAGLSVDFSELVNVPDHSGVKDRSLEMVKLKDSVIYPDNLFNLSSALDNSLFNSTTGAPLTANGYMLSDFIEVQYQKQYTIPNANMSNAVAVYDVNKAFIGKLTGTVGNNNPYSFTITNANIKYIRLNIDKSKVDVNKYMMIQGGQLPVIYVPYNEYLYSLDGLTVDYDNLINVPVQGGWQDKSVYLFGDSITYWDQRYDWIDGTTFIVGYPSYIREKLKPKTLVNKGSSGATISTVISNSIHTILKGTDLTTVDAITITGGANDYSRGTVLGSLGERNDTVFDPLTFYGSLRDMVHYAYSQNPKIKIYFLAPLQLRGSNLSQFTKAFKDVGSMYGIPVLSMGEVVQINPVTETTLTFDGTHPNNEGYKVMADAIVPFLQNY